MQYVLCVERVLNALIHAEAQAPGEHLRRLWKQLAVCANALGLRCVEQRRLALALDLFKKMEALAENTEVVDPAGKIVDFVLNLGLPNAWIPVLHVVVLRKRLRKGAKGATTISRLRKEEPKKGKKMISNCLSMTGNANKQSAIAC